MKGKKALLIKSRTQQAVIHIYFSNVLFSPSLLGMKRTRNETEEDSKKLVDSIITTRHDLMDAGITHWQTVPLRIKQCMGFNETSELNLPVGPMTLLISQDDEWQNVVYISQTTEDHLASLTFFQNGEQVSIKEKNIFMLVSKLAYIIVFRVKFVNGDDAGQFLAHIYKCNADNSYESITGKNNVLWNYSICFPNSKYPHKTEDDEMLTALCQTKEGFVKSNENGTLRLYMQERAPEQKQAQEELQLNLILDGNKDGLQSMVEDQQFRNQAQNAIANKLILAMDANGFDYWPHISGILNLSMLSCKKFIVKNSFFDIVPPKQIEEFEYGTTCAYRIYDIELPKLKKLVVASEEWPSGDFITRNYPVLEELEINCGQDFDDIVETVKAMDILPCLKKITVTYDNWRFIRLQESKVFFDFLLFNFVFLGHHTQMKHKVISTSLVDAFKMGSSSILVSLKYGLSKPVWLLNNFLLCRNLKQQ